MKKNEKNNKKNINNKIVIFLVSIIIVCIVVVLLFLTKSNKQEDSLNYITKTVDNFQSVLKTNKYSLKLVGIDNTNNKEQTITLARNNKTYVMATDTERIVIKGDYMYAIRSIDKTMMKTTIVNTATGYSFFKIVEGNIVDKGTEKINNKKYKYENYGGVKLYLSNNIMEYIEVNGLLCKIESISGEIDESLFEIPTDYTIVSGNTTIETE